MGKSTILQLRGAGALRLSRALAGNCDATKPCARNRASCRSGAEQIRDKGANVADDPAMFPCPGRSQRQALAQSRVTDEEPHEAPADHPVRILEALQDARCSLLHNQCLGAADAECAAQAFLLASKLIDR